jgi:hypothetical protein
MSVKHRAKTWLKSALPEGCATRQRLVTVRRAWRWRRGNVANVFTDIYQHNRWQDPESVSGRGSTLARTTAIRQALPALLKDLGVTSLLDAACGDFNWLRHVDLSGINYTGADIVPALIARNQKLYGHKERAFIVLNLIKDRLPTVDAILCRDLFIHLSCSHIRAAIDNFKQSKSNYLLTTTHTSVAYNSDIETGDWRTINLHLPPFNFPPPVCSLVEDPTTGKRLSVWRLAEL